MDSKALLAKQIQLHVDTLSALLSSPAGELPATSVVHRCVLSTRMLSGSAFVMGLGHWAELSAAFGGLLNRYERSRSPWDDRVADVTSELIEKEETLLSAFAADPSCDLDSVIPQDETVALISELGVLKEEFESLAESARTDCVEPAVTVDLDPEPGASAGFEAEPGRESPRVGGQESGEGPMPGVVAALRESFARLEALFEAPAWRLRAWESSALGDVRNELSTIDFCTRSIERVIEDRANSSACRPLCTLTPLRIALDDFARELTHESGRALAVDLVGSEHAIDPGLLGTAGLVLQSMITDAFQRCDGDSLRVQVSAEPRHGVLHWRVTDDGDNYVSDSRLDNDDQLAFYPRLRTAINRLARHRGVLWVEPGPGPRSRFEFTLPASTERDALVVWGEGGSAFAARATQVCAVLPSSSPNVKSDNYGQHVEIDGARVPLFRLDGLYNEAPAGGDTVVVIGSIDKRIAFFVPGPGTVKEAHVSHDAVPAWHGAPSLVAQVDGRRLPLLDADHVVDAYHAVTGTLSAEGVSGGVQDETDSFPRQAASKVDVPAPPEPYEGKAGESGVDVLVVEQSESMREALTAILDARQVRSVCTGEVDEAIGLIETYDPRLIISEFRMPTMAAKRVVDTLKRSGRGTPVLVTTSQTGKTAELLVEKLGASGYLSKPLDTDEVSSTVGAYLGERIPS